MFLYGLTVTWSATREDAVGDINFLSVVDARPQFIKAVALTRELYVEMSSLMRDCRLVTNDSGGMQKEALWAGVPCVTSRDVTEWTDTVKHGFNSLVGRDLQRLKEALLKVDAMGFASAEYRELTASFGSGKAADRTVETLLRSTPFVETPEPLDQ